MSHFTRIRTQMVELDYITKALDDLGYEWQAGDQTLHGFAGARRKVAIRVKTGFLSQNIGFIKSDQGFDLVADWSLVRSITRDKFNQQVTQRYAYHAARAKLEAQGFSLISEEKQPDGQVRLVLRRTG
ncbi:MAG: DUF1257 domain-containing protein [Anaerolineales bacterium]|nr:DUF1257 domain-containing protein [Anaerolineales bacterium]